MTRGQHRGDADPRRRRSAQAAARPRRPAPAEYRASRASAPAARPRAAARSASRRRRRASPPGRRRRAPGAGSAAWARLGGWARRALRLCTRLRLASATASGGTRQPGQDEGQHPVAVVRRTLRAGQLLRDGLVRRAPPRAARPRRGPVYSARLPSESCTPGQQRPPRLGPRRRTPPARGAARACRSPCARPAMARSAVRPASRSGSCSPRPYPPAARRDTRPYARGGRKSRPARRSPRRWGRVPRVCRRGEHLHQLCKLLRPLSPAADGDGGHARGLQSAQVLEQQRVLLSQRAVVHASAQAEAPRAGSQSSSRGFALPSPEHGAQPALAGPGRAELRLDGRAASSTSLRAGQGGDLLQRQLRRQEHAADAQLPRRLYARGVVQAQARPRQRRAGPARPRGQCG